MEQANTKKGLLGWLTGGDPALCKRAVSIAWPAVLETFCMTLASLIDSLMVSRLGSYAVAAVGLTVQPRFIAMAPFMAMSVAVSALVARRKGEDDRDDANRVMEMALGLLLVFGVLIGLACIAFADPIIRLCGSAADTHEAAVIYFRIVVGGMVFSCISFIINSAQRGAGNTRISMRTNLVSSVTNIIGNWLLIGGNLGFPALGITGAALATLLGTVVASVMSLLSIWNKDSFVSLPYAFSRKLRAGWDTLKSMLNLGWAVFVEQILMRIGFMATALMAANLGTAPLAAHQVGMNLLSLSFAFGDGMQVAAVTLVGQSLGAGKPDEARRYGKQCRRLGYVISLGVALVFLIFGRALFRLFFTEEVIVNYGVEILRVLIFVVLLQIAQVIYMGALRAAGDVVYTAVVSTVCVTVIRTACSYICCYTLGMGLVGLWLGILGDQVGRYIMATLRFNGDKWINKKI